MATVQGAELLDVIVDGGESAKSLNRPGLQRLMALVNGPAVSPEGGRAAFQLIDAQGNGNIWVRDLTRGNDTRLTFDPRLDASPVWSPDGKKIIFAANRGGKMDLYEKSADGGGEERLLFKSDQDKTPTSWSRDGRFLLFDSLDPKTSEDIWILPLDQSSSDKSKDTLKPFVFLKTEFREAFAQFSPDERWIAYNANPSGSFQVYVRPFAHEQGDQGAGAASVVSGPQWMVSTTQGSYPRWSGDGKRVFFIGMSGAFMVADVQPGVTFQSVNPRRLFGDVQNFPFGATLGGDRFLFADYSTSAPGPPPPFTVVQNWYTRLKN